MSLNNIILPALSIVELYKNSLVNIEDTGTEKPALQGLLPVLGKNSKHVIIVVSNNEAAFLPDDELNFLLDILSACSLNMDDVGIVNLKKSKAFSYHQLIEDLKAEKILLFGIKPENIDLPLSFPQYQLQQYNQQVYLAAPALLNLQSDKEEKRKLWNCLKQIFLA